MPDDRPQATASGPRGERAWPHLAGRIEGAVHILPVRVYYEDTDFSGLVYHANYLKFCERGRSDFVRLIGIHHRALMEGGGEDRPAAFVVRRVEVDFLRPARIDDVLEVVTACADIGAATLTLDQRVRRGEETLVKARVTVVLVSRAGKPLRLGPMIRAAFERFVNQDG